MSTEDKVDTSSEAIQAFVFEQCVGEAGALEKVGAVALALAVERDELERLAGVMNNAVRRAEEIKGILTQLDTQGAFPEPRHPDLETLLNCLPADQEEFETALAALTAYQRKHGKE